MLLFWQRGYQAASLPDLLEATDLSRSSFYEAFGTKRELLLAALSRYVGARMGGLAEPLFREGAARAEIEETFDNMIVHALGQDGGRGCLVNTCASEVAPQDAEVLEAVRAARKGLERALASAVRRAQVQGSISNTESPRALARFLSGVLSGLNVMARTRPGKAALQDVVRVSLSVLGATGRETTEEGAA